MIISKYLVCLWWSGGWIKVLTVCRSHKYPCLIYRYRERRSNGEQGKHRNIQHSSIPLSIASMNNKNRKLNFNSWINRNFRCCTMFSCKLVFISKRYSKIPREQSWWQKCVQMLKFTFHYIFTIPSQVKLSRKAL